MTDTTPQAHPVRLQLSRKRGFNLQEHSHAVNGLPAVNVARPTKWGNPWKVGERLFNDMRRKPMTAADTVIRFRKDIRFLNRNNAIVRELRSKNLACWCPLGEPCHADVLLEVANSPVCEAVE